jgi:hypothetical protein
LQHWLSLLSSHFSSLAALTFSPDLTFCSLAARTLSPDILFVFLQHWFSPDLTFCYLAALTLSLLTLHFALMQHWLSLLSSHLFSCNIDSLSWPHILISCSTDLIFSLALLTSHFALLQHWLSLLTSHFALLHHCLSLFDLTFCSLAAFFSPELSFSSCSIDDCFIFSLNSFGISYLMQWTKNFNSRAF